MAKNQVTTLVASSAVIHLADAREAAAEAAGRSYGAERAYAKALNEAFLDMSVAWFTIEHNAKGKEAEAVHDEKAAYFKLLHAKHPAGKYPNPSVPWARVRKYAQEELKAAFGGTESEGGEGGAGESDSVGAKHSRSLTLRFTEELTSLFKAGRRAEKDGMIQKRELECLTHIASALGALGIDIGSL